VRTVIRRKPENHLAIDEFLQIFLSSQKRAFLMNIVNYYGQKNLCKSKTDLLISNIDYDADSKEIISLCIIQVFVHGEHMLEVIKYDSAHGRCHVHKYYENLDDPGQDLLDNQIGNSSIAEFKNDIRQNWAEYKRRYFRKWFKQKI